MRKRHLCKRGTPGDTLATLNVTLDWEVVLAGLEAGATLISIVSAVNWNSFDGVIASAVSAQKNAPQGRAEVARRRRVRR